jgi:hypothetical protein
VKSKFFNFNRLARTAVDVGKLWFALVVRREHIGAAAAPTLPHATKDRL